MCRLILICILSLFSYQSFSKETVDMGSNQSKNLESSSTVHDVSKNQVVLSVPGMVCQMCVHGMRKVFKDSVQSSDKDVQVDLDKKTLTLNLLTELSDDDLKKKVVQAGYKVDKITRL